MVTTTTTTAKNIQFAYGKYLLFRQNSLFNKIERKIIQLIQ